MVFWCMLREKMLVYFLILVREYVQANVIELRDNDAYITNARPYPVISLKNSEYEKRKEIYVLSEGYFIESAAVNTLSFKLPRVSFSPQVITTTLNLRITETSNIKSMYFTDSKSYLRFLQKRLFQVELKQFKTSWIKIELTRTIQKQRRHLTYKWPYRARKLFLRIELASHSPQEAKEQENSHISIQVSEDKKRVKRSSTKCLPNQSTCCLHSLWVDFHQDFGMEHVLTPLSGGYYANYCKGSCTSKKTITDRDVVFSEHGYPLSLCCVPIVYDSLKLFFANKNSGIYSRTIENSSARRCGCR